MTAPRGGPTGVQLGAAAVIAVAVVGLISGVESSGRTVASYVDRPAPSTTTVVARSYRDQRDHDAGPNAALPATWWKTLALAPTAPVPLAAEPPPMDPAARAAAIARRAERRAYDGAPPTIPHAVDPRGVPACLVCHERGARLADRVAPAMSHDRHDSCLQCHVVGADPRPGAPAIAPPVNLFVAEPPPAHGERAWPGAPPTIPHATAMRPRCESCHGPAGLAGLRTPHPWRASCTQCHPPSAALDQRAGARATAAPAPAAPTAGARP